MNESSAVNSQRRILNKNYLKNVEYAPLLKLEKQIKWILRWRNFNFNKTDTHAPKEEKKSWGFMARLSGFILGRLGGLMRVVWSKMQHREVNQTWQLFFPFRVVNLCWSNYFKMLFILVEKNLIFGLVCFHQNIFRQRNGFNVIFVVLLVNLAFG